VRRCGVAHRDGEATAVLARGNEALPTAQVRVPFASPRPECPDGEVGLVDEASCAELSPLAIRGSAGCQLARRLLPAN
jgi:hypothetical protein